MNTSPVKLLLITPQESNFLQIQELLNQGFYLPFTLNWISNLQETLTARESQQYDIYLINFQVENFRSLVQTVKPNPVLLITEDLSMGLQCLTEGFKDFLLEEQLTPVLLEHCIRLSLNTPINYLHFPSFQNQSPPPQPLNQPKIEQLGKFVAKYVPVGLYQNNAQGECIYINQATSEILDITFEECLGSGWISRLYPDDQERVLKSWELAFNSSSYWQEEYRFLQRNGNIIWVLVRCKFLFDQLGNNIGSIGAITDITKQKELTQELANSKQFIETIIDTIPIPVFWKDRSSRFLGCNQKLLEFQGLRDKEEIIGKSTFDFSPTEEEGMHYIMDDQWVMENNQSKLFIEETFTLSDGEQRWLETHKAPLSDEQGKIIGLLGMFQDITKRKETEILLKETTAKLERMNQELEKMAYLDRLTQIPNRRHFDQTLMTEWQLSQREKTPFSLMMIDIDYFKLYNDHYGHLKGDKILKIVAQTLMSIVQRPSDLVTRYGGEEFAIILPNTSVKGAQHLADLIIKKIAELTIPHQVSPINKRLTLSIGINTMLPDDLQSPEQVIHHADLALDLAKKQGRNRSIFYQPQ
ncbi:MAG: diguanylate cyclase [Microcystaceae cyanobacterium]